MGWGVRLPPASLPWPVSPSPEVRSAETWSHQQLLFPTAVHSEFPDSLLHCNNAGYLRMGNETDIPGGERNQEIAFRGALQDGRGEKGTAACGRGQKAGLKKWMLGCGAPGRTKTPGDEDQAGVP